MIETDLCEFTSRRSPLSLTVGTLEVQQVTPGEWDTAVVDFFHKKEAISPNISDEEVVLSLFENAAELLDQVDDGVFEAPSRIIGGTNPRMARFAIKNLGFRTADRESDRALEAITRGMKRKSVVTDFVGESREFLEQVSRITGLPLENSYADSVVSSSEMSGEEKIKTITNAIESLIKPGLTEDARERLQTLAREELIKTMYSLSPRYPLSEKLTSSAQYIANIAGADTDDLSTMIAIEVDFDTLRDRIDSAFEPRGIKEISLYDRLMGVVEARADRLALERKAMASMVLNDC